MSTITDVAVPRTIRAPRGPQKTCKSWQAEAAMRMLMNNLDPEVAENPAELIVYGGRGQAARSWEAFDAIIDSLKKLEADETLLVQSGKPVGIILWLQKSVGLRPVPAIPSASSSRPQTCRSSSSRTRTSSPIGQRRNTSMTSPRRV